MDSTPLPDPKSILVVDDELSVLNVIKCMLESANYSVLSANSAESALRLAERRELTIDLALIDVVMPDGSGPVRASYVGPGQEGGLAPRCDAPDAKSSLGVFPFAPKS